MSRCMSRNGHSLILLPAYSFILCEELVLRVRQIMLVLCECRRLKLEQLLYHQDHIGAFGFQECFHSIATSSVSAIVR